MALGAEAVQIGTRFVAVDENPAHPKYKQAILDASDTDTIITCRKLLPTRCLKSNFSTQLLQLEQTGATSKDLHRFLGYRKARQSQLEGDLDAGELFAGASAGLIKEILPVAKVVQNLVNGYEEVIAKLLQS
jgi:enoyl-[acyl-carrier protein] reductase II